MSTYDDIIGLRALRSFSDEPVSDHDLAALLEALRWTGSAKNHQAWSWIVVTDPDQRERVAACGDFTDPVRSAPLTIVLVQEAGGYEFDSGRLAQNLMLAAATLRLGACPITLHRETEAHTVLGLPEDVRARYAVAIGHPREGARPARLGGRKPLSELTHRNRYGH